MSVGKSFIIFLLSLLLCACLVPERFSAHVEVQPDASYTFKYTGVTAYIPAITKADATGQLSERDLSMQRADAAKMLKRPEFKRVEPLNNGRYDMEIEYHKKAGESLKMFDVFSVTTDKQGVITVSTTAIAPKEREKLKELGINMDGTLVVTLPDNAVIIEHNASSEPYFFGLLGDYEWKITHFDQQPVIKFTLKSE